MPEVHNQTLLSNDLLQKINYKIHLKFWEQRNQLGELITPNNLRKATQHLYEQLLAGGFEILSTPFYQRKNEQLGVIESSVFTTCCYQLCILNPQFPEP